MTIQYDPWIKAAAPVRIDSELGRTGLHPAESFEVSGLYGGVGKRVFDLALVVLASPIILTVIAILAPLVALEGGRPFYSQPRVGRNGRIYRMWKLRTMVHDADARLEALLERNADARDEWSRTQKLKSDPRITRFGRFLRKMSLDELPQFFNVLTGEMSIVGPRPMMPSQEALYPGRTYYSLRPGITGPWQVTDRHQSSFADRARFDGDYARNLSIVNDLKLLFATVRVVLRGTGC